MSGFAIRGIPNPKQRKRKASDSVEGLLVSIEVERRMRPGTPPSDRVYDGGGRKSDIWCHLPIDNVPALTPKQIERQRRSDKIREDVIRRARHEERLERAALSRGPYERR